MRNSVRNAIIKNRSKRAYLVLIIFALGIFAYRPYVYANTPSAGGDTTVVNPSGEGAVSVNEDAPEPESANIRLIVPTLTDSGGGTPSSIRILSVTGGTLKQEGGGSITLGSSGTTLSLSSSRVDLRFKPDSNRDTNGSFQYVVVDPHDSSNNSSASTATVPITAVNDTPLLQTLVGSTGTGLAATYYTQNWDLTGPTFNRVDSTVNFSNNFGVSGMNNDQFSVRWTGKIESPVTGNVVFSTQSDDGVRLWIDGTKIIDNWTLHGTTTDTASAVALVAGTKYDIQMEFYERGGGEVAILQWSYTGQSTQVVPQTYLFPGTVRPAMTYVNGSGAVVIDDAITLSDVDNTTMASAAADISTNFQSGEDSLQFTNQNGISGSYSNGVLALTGTATSAQYQTALRSIKYANSAGTPVSSTRTVRFRVYDGATYSNYVFRNIQFSATNNPPVITQGTSTSVTMDEDGSPTAFSLSLDATDADEHSISWSISSQASHGTASAGNPGNNVTINYTPTSNYNGTDSFIVQAADGAGGTDTITVNVTITSDGIDESITPTSAATPTPGPTNTPTPKPTDPADCSREKPSSAPDLFQISASLTSATISFTPVSPSSGYFLSYGTKPEADEFAAAFDHSDSGAISYTVNSLIANTTYYFKVRGTNGCKSGDWSNIKSSSTTGGSPIISSTLTEVLTHKAPATSSEKNPEPQPTSKLAPSQTSPKGDGLTLDVVVLDHNQKPVEGATVTLHSKVQTAKTDKNGIAHFENVEKGEHKVMLAYNSYKGEQKLSLDGSKKVQTLTLQVNVTNGFSSTPVILVILLLVLIIFFLIFLIKRRKKEEDTKHKHNFRQI